MRYPFSTTGPKVEVDKTGPFPVNQVHPLFRVWFITQGEDPHSVPGSHLHSSSLYTVYHLVAERTVYVFISLTSCCSCCKGVCPSPGVRFSLGPQGTAVLVPVLRCVLPCLQHIHPQRHPYGAHSPLCHSALCAAPAASLPVLGPGQPLQLVRRFRLWPPLTPNALTSNFANAANFVWIFFCSLRQVQVGMATKKF